MAVGSFTKAVTALTGIVVLVGLAACAPAYDLQADQGITAVQHSVDGKIVSLISLDQKIHNFHGGGTPAEQKALAKARDDASYDANVAFYDATDTDLTSAQMRVDALPNRATPKIDQTFDALRDVLLSAPQGGADPTSMRAVHAAQDHLSAAYLRSLRTQSNALFSTLIQYEATLKTGKSASN